MRRFLLDALLLASIFVSVAYFQPARASPDFSISANPSSARGPALSSTITLTSLGGFSGNVNVSATVYPPGPSISLTSVVSSTSVILDLTSGGSASTPLFASSGVAGNFTINVTGTNGSLSHSIPVIFLAEPPPEDFSIDCCFPLGHGYMGRVAVGTNYTSWGWVTSLNHFSGQVSISITLNLNIPVTVSPSTVNVTDGGTVYPDVTFQVPSGSTPGEYYGAITGTNGTITHSEALTLTVDPPVPDYSISANPVSIKIDSWFSGLSTITVTSINGFSTHWGCLNLDVVVHPSPAEGPVPTIRPSCVNLVSGGTTVATLSFFSDLNTPTGNYTFIVSACLPTSGLGLAICRFTTVYVTITKNNDDPPVAAAVGGSSVAALMIAVAVLRRKRAVVPV